MNITIYSDNLDVEILPAYCNWTLIEAIKFDKKQNTFVEPYLPNHEIGIIHLAGKNNDNIRNDKNYSFLIEIDGGVNLQNSKELVNLGADVLVAGSFVFKSQNPIETIKKLKQC